MKRIATIITIAAVSLLLTTYDKGHHRAGLLRAMLKTLRRWLHE